MSESSKFYVTFLIIAFVTCNQDFEAPQHHHRVRRALSFQNGTRILFRVNVKDNIIRVNQIFAHAYGFRANIDMLAPPRNYQKYQHKVRKRDVLATFEQLMIQQGLDGRSCVLKMICDAYQKPESSETGMFFKLYKLIFKHDHADDYEGVNIPQLLDKGCSSLKDSCPLNLLQLTPFTDIIV